MKQSRSRILRTSAILLVFSLLTMRVYCGSDPGDDNYFESEAFWLILTLPDIGGGGYANCGEKSTGNPNPSGVYNEWNFNNALTDEKGNHDFDLSDSNAVFTTAQCREGGYSIRFDGSTGSIKTSSSWRPGADYTIAGWIRVHPNATGTMYSVSNSGGFRWAYDNSTGKMDIGFATPAHSVSVEKGVWTHIVFTNSGSESIVYVNGKQESNSTTTFDSSAWGTMQYGFRWRGELDDIITYDSVLSSSQVAELYDAYQFR